MTAKEYLTQLARMRKDLGYRMEQVKALLEIRKQGIEAGGAPDRLLQKKEAIALELDQLYAMGEEVFTLLDALEDCEHRTVLTLRYVRGMPWNMIAQRMHYSTRHLNRLHNEAMENATRILKNGDRKWTISSF